MGEDEITTEIFEFQDRNGNTIGLFEAVGEGYKKKFLSIDSEFGDLELTKPLVRKIIIGLKEEFKIED